MRLHGLCYYRSKSDTWTSSWESVHYAARNVVKAVKSLPFNGSSTIQSGNVNVLIDNTAGGRARAIDAVASALASKIAQAGYQEVAVVPIPSSSHVDPGAMFTGRRIAEAIQSKQGNFTSTPILYFDKPLPKSSSGGSRNPYTIQQHLRLATCDLPQNIILLDDVATTCGHLKGAARFLAERGRQVNDAFVVGRTTWSEPESMFAVATEEVQTIDLFDL